ncbi:MAG: cadherin-like domain-containing protein [Nanoarchaeota archaeon]|nr:cadherin-like domain-containing protein [Nanoarchaeota archaeon]
MGKRYLILIIAALLFVHSAFAAITVDLNAPAPDATQSSSTVSFNCDASEDDILYEISNISLYIDSVKNKTQSGLSLVLDVTNMPLGAHTWYCEGVNNASATASSSIRTFTISAANTAPSFSGIIPNKTFNEDSTLPNAFDLDNYFTDSTALTYSAESGSHITVSIAADGQVSFSSTNNWSGSELIRFTASDGSLTNTSNYINVSVTAVNDAPYYSEIPTQNMTKNTNLSINLNTYFNDVEGTTLTYNVSTAPSHMNYTISSNTITLVPETNWVGTTTISFTASDGNATTTSNTVTLNVTGGNATGNRAPRVSCSPTLDKVYADAGEGKVFRITAKSDPDTGDTLNVVWKVDGANIDGETGDSYTFSKNDPTDYTVAVVVSDGSLDASCSWTVTVSAAAASNFTSAVDVDSIIAEQTEGVPRCGNSIAGETLADGSVETCSNCPDDVKCAENETCQSGVCVPKTGLKTVLMIMGIALIVILGGGFIVYKLSMKRKVQTRVRDGRTLSSVDKEHPSVDMHDIYHEDDRIKAEAAAPEPQENPLKSYIDDMRKKGVSDDEIAQALKNKGWSELMIKHALKK